MVHTGNIGDSVWWGGCIEGELCEVGKANKVLLRQDLATLLKCAGLLY